MTTIHVVRKTSRRRAGGADRERIRRWLAVGAVIATLPYSALKVAWLTGSRIGLSDPAFGTSVTMHVLNDLTLGLDLVALALAVIFFVDARPPHWFVLPTMWVGYGLLGQIVMSIGPSVIVQAIAGEPAADGHHPAPIAPWVYVAVYTGFSGLGLCLLPAFAIYAWQHWADAGGWSDRLGGIRREMPVAPSTLAAVVTVALLVRAIRSDSAVDATGWAVDALIGLVVLLSLAVAARGRPAAIPRAMPLAGVWTASGAWTAWGVYHLVLETIPNDLATTAASAPDIVLQAAKVAAGASLLLTVRRLASSDSGRSSIS